MVSHDPQLDFFAADPARETAAKNVHGLEELLRSRPGWHTAAQLLQILGQAEDEDLKRTLRQLAASSEWILSGQKGYKHLEHATAEEINHFCCWMESRAKAMTARAETLRRNAHRIFG